MQEIEFSEQSKMKWAIRWLSSFTITTLLASFLGIWLDKQFHSAPFMILCMLAYAIFGNFYKLWKELSKDE